MSAAGGTSAVDELVVPTAAAQELTAVVLGLRDDTGVDEIARRVAGPIVAAELRRLADTAEAEVDSHEDEPAFYAGGDYVIQKMRDYADQLAPALSDPPARTAQ